MDADPKAARLWAFLETENLSAPHLYSLYPRPGQGPRDTSAIADLLRISKWGNRTRVWQRVQRACDVIMGIDQRYRLQVQPAARATRPKMWNLSVSRSDANARPGVGTPGKTGGYSWEDRWVPLVREVGTSGKGHAGKSLQIAADSESAVGLPSGTTYGSPPKGTNCEPNAFDKAWLAYPANKRGDKKQAAAAWRRKIKSGLSGEALAAAVETYADAYRGANPKRYKSLKNLLWDDGTIDALLAGTWMPPKSVAKQTVPDQGPNLCPRCGKPTSADDELDGDYIEGRGFCHVACRAPVT
jgi:hypothetical protein